jgi:hypothetical protein
VSNSIFADYPLEKCRINAYAKTTKNMMKYQKLMTYLCDREVVAMLDYDSSSRVGFLVPCIHEDGIGFWHYTSIKQLTLWRNVLAARKIAAEIEAARIAVEAEVARKIAAEIEAARIAVEAEAAMKIDVKVEAARIAAEVEATRIASVIARHNTFLAAEVEAARLSAAEVEAAHRPVEQSPECKQAERDRYEFVMQMINIHDIWYLKGKTADKSPTPQALPARAAKRLKKVMRFYNAHYAPESQGENSYTDPRTGGPTCKTNKIIYDTIYDSLPDDCKLTFAQMFDNFDDLCPFKAPLCVKGEKFDFEKHILNLLTDAERAEWWCLTGNHLKWKYIDAIKNRVSKAIVLVFGRLPKKYWPNKHQEALQMAREHILLTEERVVEFTLEIVTCDHFSLLCFGREDEVIVEMQEALKKSQGGILKGRAADHLMLKYNRAKSIIREKKAVNAIVCFFSEWA